MNCFISSTCTEVFHCLTYQKFFTVCVSKFYLFIYLFIYRKGAGVASGEFSLMLEPESSIFWNIWNFFRDRVFRFSSFALKTAPGNPIIYYSKMKNLNCMFGFKEIVYFINNQPVNQKKSIVGEYSTDKNIGITGLVLKNWTDDDQTMTSIIRGILILFVPRSIAIFCDDGRNGISLVHERTFSTQPHWRQYWWICYRKDFFRMLVYRSGSATIESRITMD